MMFAIFKITGDLPLKEMPLRNQILARCMPMGSEIVLGADYAPSTLGLHAAVRGVAVGHVMAVGIAVRDLVKPVFRRLWADFYRLEQNVVTGIACHLSISPSCIL